MKNEVLRTNLWLQYVSIVGYFAKYYSEMLTFEVRNLPHYTIGLLMLLRVYCCVGVSTVDFVALRRCMLHCQLLRFVSCLRDLLSQFRIRYVSELHFVKVPIADLTADDVQGILNSRCFRPNLFLDDCKSSNSELLQD